MPLSRVRGVSRERRARQAGCAGRRECACALGRLVLFRPNHCKQAEAGRGGNGAPETGQGRCAGGGRVSGRKRWPRRDGRSRSSRHRSVARVARRVAAMPLGFLRSPSPTPASRPRLSGSVRGSAPAAARCVVGGSGAWLPFFWGSSREGFAHFPGSQRSPSAALAGQASLMAPTVGMGCSGAGEESQGPRPSRVEFSGRPWPGRRPPLFRSPDCWSRTCVHLSTCTAGAAGMPPGVAHGWH